MLYYKVGNTDNGHSAIGRTAPGTEHFCVIFSTIETNRRISTGIHENSIISTTLSPDVYTTMSQKLYGRLIWQHPARNLSLVLYYRPPSVTSVFRPRLRFPYICISYFQKRLISILFPFSRNYSFELGEYFRESRFGSFIFVISMNYTQITWRCL